MKPTAAKLTRIERRLRRAAGLEIAGLLVAALSLLWIHPLALLAFAFVACSIVGLGCMVYLLALVQFPEDAP